MSRIGKKVIEIPANTEVTISDGIISVKGPLGQLSMNILPNVVFTIADNTITSVPARNDIFSKALWGTYASRVTAMIQGVNKEFEKKLVLEGVGYRVELKGESLVFNVGFSHPVELVIPEGIKAVVEKNNITVSGIDKVLVGQFAANIRAIKKPEPYKGKGLRYSDEVVRRKEGKKAL